MRRPRLSVGGTTPRSAHQSAHESHQHDQPHGSVKAGQQQEATPLKRASAHADTKKGPVGGRLPHFILGGLLDGRDGINWGSLKVNEDL